MKKLLLIPIFLIALSCSDDDGGETKKVEVISYSSEVHEVTEQGHIFEFTATVKNNKSTEVTGDVKFTIPTNTGGNEFDYIFDVTLMPGETKMETAVGGGYYNTNVLTISKAEFIED